MVAFQCSFSWWEGTREAPAKDKSRVVGPKRLLQTAPEKTWSNTEAGGWFLQVAREN